MERKITKEISQDEWYIPYEDVIYRLDGYVISDLEEEFRRKQDRLYSF